MPSFKKASFKEGSNVIFNDYWNELLTEEVNNLFDEFVFKVFENIRNYEDERAFVLVSAMLLENCLDGYLYGYIPGFDDFRKLREVTFSTKIELAKSLYLSPIDKLNALDIIRKIRNQFAHYLPITRLEEIKKSYKQSLLDNLRKFEKIDLKVDNESTKEIFEKLVLNVCRMLIWYTFHIGLLHGYIRNEKIYDDLENFYRLKQQEEES